MILFFDTSAIVKLFHREEGTDVVTSIVTNQDNTIWLSELARIEIVCAFHRRYRMKEIKEDDITQAIQGLSLEFSRFSTMKIGTAVLSEAETLVTRLGRELGLRALDSIHLATFSLLNQLQAMPFVAADDVLLAAARRIGAKTINPLVGPKIVPP